MNQVIDFSNLEKLPDFESRKKTLEEAADIGFPEESTEEWRYSNIDSLELTELEPKVERPQSIEVDCSDAYSAEIVVQDGWLVGFAINSEVSQTLTINTVPAPAETGTPVDYFSLTSAALAPEVVRIELSGSSQLSKPIMVRTAISPAIKLAAPSIEVIADAGSQIEVLRQAEGGSESLELPSVRLYAARDAIINFHSFQNLDSTCSTIGTVYGSAEAQSSVNYSSIGIGANYCRQRIDIDLDGRGSTAKIVAPSFSLGSQVNDSRVYVNHKGVDTTSDLYFKSISGDSAGSIYTGLIHIFPDASGSNAYQTNRSLKISEDAWAWSVPNLEIENNEVRCSHASTVNPIDPEQQFYLQARGVSPDDANRLIVSGFFKEILNKVINSELREIVAEVFETKLEEVLPAEVAKS